MALEFQTVDVKFTRGIDAKTQQKLVVPGTWTSLINMSLSEEYTPKTRDGHGEFGSTNDGGNGLATFNSELLIINGAVVSSFSPTAAAATAVAGQVGVIGISKTEVYRSTGFQDALDCAYGNGYVAYVWRDLTGGGTVNGIKCTILDNTSGTPVLAATTLRASATAATPRVVFANNAFFFLYLEGNTDLYCNVVATSAPSALGTAVSVVTSGGGNISNKNIDACANPAGTGVAVAYGWLAGADSIRLVDVVRTGTVPSVFVGPVQVAASATIAVNTLQGLSVCSYGDARFLGVFYATSTALFGMAGTVIDYVAYGTAILSVSTATTALDGGTFVLAVAGPCHIVAVALGNGTGSYVMEVMADQQSSYGTVGFRPITTVAVSTTLTNAGGPYDFTHSSCFDVNAARASGPQGPFIAGKPFVANTINGFAQVYLPLMVLENYFQSTLGANTANPNAQCSFFLININIFGLASTVVGHALYGALGLVDVTLGGAAPSVSTPCSTPAVSAGLTFITAQLERLTLQTAQGINITPTGICRLSLTRDPTDGPIRAQLGQTTFLSGGQLTGYDGSRIVEHGFPLYPEGISVVVTAAAAGSVTVGTHSLVATYEWTDAAGQRHQSAPSPAVQFTFVNATDQADVIVPTLLLSQKPNIIIALWMTEASGQTFYRVVNSFATPMANQTNAAIVSFSGAAAIGRGVVGTDARIRQGEILYSEPTRATDTLANIIPAPCTAFIEHQNRLFADCSDDPGAVQYSQALVPNTGLMFNPSLRLRLPSSGGGYVTCASLDEKLIIFCKRRIFVVYGTGPRPDGTYATYSEPQDVQGDVGCSDARSVLAELPGGIMFKSPQGWYLLGRGLETRYIGGGAAAYDSYRVIAATLVEDQQQARFLLSGSEGVELVYSYEVDAWSVTQYAAYNPLDAVWWTADGTGNYATISSANGLNHDIAGQLYDSISGNGAAAFTWTAITGWLHLPGMEAWQRVRRMYVTATSQDTPASSLAVTCYLDDSAAAAFGFTVPTSTVWVANQPFDFRNKLAIQKCKSLRVKLVETPTAATSNRLSGIQAMALEIGIKRGLNKLPAGQTVG